MSRNYGFRGPPIVDRAPTWLIALAAITVLSATVVLAVYLAMKGHGHA